jgi:K+-sensing histidine kinase KdpD
MDNELPPATPAQAERLHHFAHDLRNRLAAMQQVMRMLVQPEGGMDPAELGTFGEQQFFKAMRTVEGLLDDLSVERGTGPVSTTPVDPGRAIATAVNDLAHRFNKKDQRVETTGATGVLTLADPALLDRSLAALLSNASKFSPAGSSIRIAVEHMPDQVLVHVIDNGVGLNEADLEQVFVRYAWLDSTPTANEAQGRSTLARVRQWALAMGGDLSAASKGPGQGCTFTLSLQKA